MNPSPIKKVTCHVVAAPVERPFTSSRGYVSSAASRDRARGSGLLSSWWPA